jgi:NlpC/P60 family/S-layer homology domain
MGPGGSFRRRSTTPAALIGALVCASLVAGASSAAAQRGPIAASRGSGATDTSIPQTRIVYPTSPARFASSATTTIAFSDLDATDGWAKEAIRWVAATNAWMRDYAANEDGSYPFRPDRIETRKQLARAIVEAFAPDEAPDASIVFPDLDASNSWYRYAAIAVKHGWIGTEGGGGFAPDDGVTMAMLHRALVLPLGLKPAVKALNHLHTHAGQTFTLPRNFGTTLLGMRLYLRYNAPTGKESMDVGPLDLMSRAQVAYSLWRATTQPSYVVPALLEQYDHIKLPKLGDRMMKIVQWGVRYDGYPYVWGGEWGFTSPEPPALGGQPRSGFDCSGFSWWLLRADDGGAWNIAPPRPYDGWSLPQRASADMARMTSTKIHFADLRPGDLMFYDGDRDGTVDHVDTYIGRGYSLDSSSSPGGVTIMWVGDGWYRDHFKFGRRILPG